MLIICPFVIPALRREELFVEDGKREEFIWRNRNESGCSTRNIMETGNAETLEKSVRQNLKWERFR
jgi:hypothetical protein